MSSSAHRHLFRRRYALRAGWQFLLWQRRPQYIRCALLCEVQMSQNYIPNCCDSMRFSSAKCTQTRFRLRLTRSMLKESGRYSLQIPEGISWKGWTPAIPMLSTTSASTDIPPLFFYKIKHWKQTATHDHGTVPHRSFRQTNCTKTITAAHIGLVQATTTRPLCCLLISIGCTTFASSTVLKSARARMILCFSLLVLK